MKFGPGSGGPRWEVGWFYKNYPDKLLPPPSMQFPRLQASAAWYCRPALHDNCRPALHDNCRRLLHAHISGCSWWIYNIQEGYRAHCSPHCSTAAPLQPYLLICTKQRRVSSAFILAQIFWLILNWWGQRLQKIELNQNINPNKSLNN